MTDLTVHRKKVDRLASDRDRAKANEKVERMALTLSEGKVGSNGKAQRIVQGIAQTIQQRLHEQIAQVVTRCLVAVFEEPYEFRIIFERKRGKTEARLAFVRDGLVCDSPLDEVGGGVVDVAALALRLACILLSRPRRRRLIVLDEPLRNIRGKGNRQRVRRMLMKLAEELEIQFLINVDIDAYPEFALGKIVEVG